MKEQFDKDCRSRFTLPLTIVEEGGDRWIQDATGAGVPLDDLISRLNDGSAPSHVAPNAERVRLILKGYADSYREIDRDPANDGNVMAGSVYADFTNNIIPQVLEALACAPSTTARTTVATVVTAALVMAKGTLERWAELYGKLSEAYPKVRQMDYNLPPGDHVRTLEAIDVAIPESKVSAASAIRQSREEAYRRAFVLLLAEVMASGWFHADPSMKAKVVAYLHTANLNNEHFTVEKVLHDAMGIPTDADRAFVAAGGEQT